MQYNGEEGDLEDKLELESRDDLTDSPIKQLVQSVDTLARGVSDIVDLDGPSQHQLSIHLVKHIKMV